MQEDYADITQLHEMNPLNRFSDRATAYAKFRPSYPEEAIAKCCCEAQNAIILEGFANLSQRVAADIGAGTGISSRLLAQNGLRVIAIEPNQKMREAAKPHELVEFRNGTAENTNLPDASVDLVTCFQAFHWFNPKPTLQEFQRILKPSGRLAVVWNNRDQDDGFTQKYTRLVKIASNQHPAESRLVSIEPLLVSELFTQVDCHTFTYRQALNLEELIGRAKSTSYIPQIGEVHQQLIGSLTELYNSKRDKKGLVYLTYLTSVYLAKAKPAVII